MSRRLILRVFFLFALIVVPFKSGWAEYERHLPTSRISLEAKEGIFTFDVEVAATPEAWTQGLMFRRSLPKDSGMLFAFREEDEIVMWMKDTYIPLDMIFFDRSGRVMSISEKTQPLSLSLIRSPGPAWAVLEVNAGTAARIGLQPGDRACHSIFSGAGAC